MSRQAEHEPGTVELRLYGASRDAATVISVLERLAAGLPVTTLVLEIIHHPAPRPGRRDPAPQVCRIIRVVSDGAR